MSEFCNGTLPQKSQICALAKSPVDQRDRIHSPEWVEFRFEADEDTRGNIHGDHSNYEGKRSIIQSHEKSIRSIL